MSKITIYTDGSCLANGKEINEGGFGVVVVDENENLLYTYKKRNKNTTNNREELRAILYSFLKYGVKTDNMWIGPNNTYIPVVYSDSAYCVNTFNNWMFNWAKKG